MKLLLFQAVTVQNNTLELLHRATPDCKPVQGAWGVSLYGQVNVESLPLAFKAVVLLLATFMASL